ncbi:sensor histidine kinase [Allonocardiopsis opalescens]|nr:histidine kinase [Allonocardiopsis opalescens]
MARMWRRLWRLAGSDDPETGWLVRAASTVALLWAALAAPPHGAPLWVWVLFGAGLTCWLAYALGDPVLPRASIAALALCSLLTAPLAGSQSAAGVVLFYVALSTFALHLRPGVPEIAGLLAADLALALAAMQLLWQRSPAAMLAHAAAFAGVVLFALHRRQYRVQARQTALLLERTRQAQAERARAAALDERARIARELHDVLAHSLGALSVQLELAEALLTERGDTEGAAQRLHRARGLAAEGLEEARAAVAALREDPPPLPDALAALAAAHTRDHAVPVRLGIEGEPVPLPAAAEVSLARAAREALTNAARHAPGAPVRVELRYLDGGARLRVRNEPPADPPPPSRPGGHGLAGMRERLALAGGTLEAGPQDDGDRGWTVTAEVPGARTAAAGDAPGGGGG